VKNIAEALARTDPTNPAGYQARAAAYIMDLEVLDAWETDHSKSSDLKVGGEYEKIGSGQVIVGAVPSWRMSNNRPCTRSSASQARAALRATTRCARPKIGLDNRRGINTWCQAANVAAMRPTGRSADGWCCNHHRP